MKRLELAHLLLPILGLVLSPAAFALSCDVNIGDMNYGAVSTLSGAPTDAQSTLSYSCSASLQELAVDSVVTLCVSIDAGSGGAYLGPPAGFRKLANGADVMLHDLYSDAARGQVWGSNFDGSFGTQPPTIRLPLSLLGGGVAASGSGNRPLYGRVVARQATLPVGTYLSSFGGQVQAVYDFASRLPDCNGALTGNNRLQPVFAVSASVAGQCSVSATSLDFGSVGLLNSPVHATSTIAVTCVAGTPFQIGLSAGTGVGASFLNRKMTQQGPTKTESVSYSLFRDAARTQVWGNALEVDTVPGVANGSPQSFIVYGQIPSQVTPPPGVYIDTIIAAVTF